MDIHFCWKGMKYKVDGRVYEESKRISLPDGTVLDVKGWKKGYPKEPEALQELCPRPQIELRLVVAAEKI